MDPAALLAITFLLAAGALLYASVGHGGASAYLAIMALFSVTPEIMRPTALALNVVVSGIGVAAYGFKGQSNFRLLLSFAVAAMPAAFVGGMVELGMDHYRPLVGLVLWAAAVRFLWQPRQLAYREVRAPNPLLALAVGLVLGLLAGITGTGGGIFLSPLIILFGWETPRHTSGVAAGFVFLNSLAGLAGNFTAVQSLPPELPILVTAVIMGGGLGTWLGVKRLPRARLLQALALVLTLAGYKLIFT